VRNTTLRASLREHISATAPTSRSSSSLSFHQSQQKKKSLSPAQSVPHWLGPAVSSCKSCSARYRLAKRSRNVARRADSKCSWIKGRKSGLKRNRRFRKCIRAPRRVSEPCRPLRCDGNSLRDALQFPVQFRHQGLDLSGQDPMADSERLCDRYGRFRTLGGKTNEKACRTRAFGTSWDSVKHLIGGTRTIE